MACPVLHSRDDERWQTTELTKDGRDPLFAPGAPALGREVQENVSLRLRSL
jgi:hypothetical protein